MDFTNLTLEELKNVQEVLEAQIKFRKEIEREKHKTEFENLLIRINELQDEYGFGVSCLDGCSGDWIESAVDFNLID